MSVCSWHRIQKAGVDFIAENGGRRWGEAEEEGRQAVSARLEFSPDTPLSLKEAAEVLLHGLVKSSTLRGVNGRSKRCGRGCGTTK